MDPPRHDRVFAGAAALLVICLIAGAGCASIPGPEARFTPLPTTKPVVVTPQVKETAAMATAVPATPVPAATPPVRATATPVTVITQGIYETRSCQEQGGSVAGPGYSCPGAWLLAGDTFNCCTTAPVRMAAGNASITIPPLDVVIVMDDDPGTFFP